MLHQVLQKIEQANGPVALNDLAHQLHIDSTALTGMIQFWVQKGRLSVNDDPIEIDHSQCGDGCHIEDSCPYIVKIPTIYTVKKDVAE